VIYIALDRFSGKGPVTTPEGRVAATHGVEEKAA
jgi:hypothetical protein